MYERSRICIRILLLTFLNLAMELKSGTQEDILNQESGWYDNTGNLYPTYTEPTSYSIQLSYAAMSDYWADNY
jgi:hypothetical protein